MIQQMFHLPIPFWYSKLTGTWNVSIGSSTCKKVKSKFSISKLTAFTRQRGMAQLKTSQDTILFPKLIRNASYLKMWLLLIQHIPECIITYTKNMIYKYVYTSIIGVEIILYCL